MRLIFRNLTESYPPTNNCLYIMTIYIFIGVVVYRIQILFLFIFIN